MKISLKYQPFIAAILLVGYAFIATPTQLWHHHGMANAASSIHDNDTVALNEMNAATPQIVEEDCSICSHHYSAYVQSFLIIGIIAFFIPVTQENLYLLSFPKQPYFTLSNKGPPSSVA